MRNDRDFLPGENAHTRVFRVLSDGIIYLFQYGYISEAKHFEMLDELEKNMNTGNGNLTNTRRKF